MANSSVPNGTPGTDLKGQSSLSPNGESTEQVKRSSTEPDGIIMRESKLMPGKLKPSVRSAFATNAALGNKSIRKGELGGEYNSFAKKFEETTVSQSNDVNGDSKKENSKVPTPVHVYGGGSIKSKGTNNPYLLIKHGDVPNYSSNLIIV